MTAALASYVDDLELPAEPGISTRAIRAVLRMMAKIANDAGGFRYGLRGSKLATLTEYSLSVVRRAQRYLVEHSLVERVQVGGGRASTRWRIVVHKLRPDLDPRHASGGSETQQAGERGTAQEHTHKLFQQMHQGSQSPGSSAPPPRGQTAPVALCEHGDEAGRLASGQPRCPLCRQHVRRL